MQSWTNMILLFKERDRLGNIYQQKKILGFICYQLDFSSGLDIIQKRVIVIK